MPAHRKIAYHGYSLPHKRPQPNQIDARQNPAKHYRRVDSAKQLTNQAYGWWHRCDKIKTKENGS
jgi:hypothetical protein